MDIDDMFETEWAKVYHKDVKSHQLADLRNGKLSTGDGECWQYHYTSWDSFGKHDLMFRKVFKEPVRVIKPEEIKEIMC